MVLRKPKVASKRGESPADSRINAMMYNVVFTGSVNSAATINAPPIIRAKDNRGQGRNTSL